MSNRRKPNPSRAALEAYLLKVREWNDLLDSPRPVHGTGGLDKHGEPLVQLMHRPGSPVHRRTTAALLRRDMDHGQLKHAHLSDEELEAAVREMGRIARKLPRDPGMASHELLGAMGL